MHTCSQVAQMYHVTTATVRGWIRRRELTAIRIGKRYCIRQEDLDAFEKSRLTADAAPKGA